MSVVNSSHLMQSRKLPRRTIRFWLNCLVVTCILPAVVVATAIIVRSFNQERAGLERDTIGTARALSQAVDAELKGARSALLVLAASPYLASGDLARFYDEAQRMVPALNVDNIVLSDLVGQQLVNTLLPYGVPLPLHGDREQLRRVIETGRPVISDLFIGKVTGKPIIVIEAPAQIDGKTRYTLAMGIFPERLSAILRRQKMPPDWVAAIVDSSETIVARTVGGDEFIGKKVSPDLTRALRAAGEGAFEGTTLEGVAVLSSFSRSQFSGWTVAIGIPKEGLFGFLWEALLGNIIAAVVLLVVGISLAGAISARIARSIRALREPAVGLGLPGPITVPSVNIQEVHELGQSLVAAHQLIEQRTAERNNLRRRIMRSHELERVRLAHDIHDQTGQSFTAAILELKAIEPFVHEKGLGRLRLLRKQLDGIGQLLHRIAWELRPPSIDELGLTSALLNYLEEWGKKHAITVDFQNIDAKLNERSDEIRTTIYRVIQEALTNVAKHAANATHVGIVIGTTDDTLYLTIEDNGRGFNPVVPTSRLGLAGMRERLMLVGGHLEIESSKAGTTIFARIPLLSERAAA
jgi:signal transduction histidine kinase